jgi:hypothetical protein
VTYQDYWYAVIGARRTAAHVAQALPIRKRETWAAWLWLAEDIAEGHRHLTGDPKRWVAFHTRALDALERAVAPTARDLELAAGRGGVVLDALLRQARAWAASVGAAGRRHEVEGHLRVAYELGVRDGCRLAMIERNEADSIRHAEEG